MLDIDQVNRYLKEGYTVAQIRKELGIGEKLFQKQVKQLKYRYNQKTKQYEPIEDDYSSNTKVINYHSNTGVINSNDVNLDIKKMTDLVNSYDDIKQVLDWFKNREYDNSIIEVIPNNKIEINIDTTETKRTTVLVNSQIYNEFNQFCNKHKEFDKKDLLSMALKEYMQKYD